MVSYKGTVATSSIWVSLSVAAAVALALAPAACNTKEPQQSTYFERTISPILTTSCVRTNTGAACHVSDEKGNAFGNLDTATFAGLNHRRDLLADYGPYGQPALLVKNVAPFQVEVQSYDGQKATVTTDIKHTGGPILDPTATGYQTIRRWVENGATENNTGAPSVGPHPNRSFIALKPSCLYWLASAASFFNSTLYRRLA